MHSLEDKRRLEKERQEQAKRDEKLRHQREKIEAERKQAREQAKKTIDESFNEKMNSWSKIKEDLNKNVSEFKNEITKIKSKIESLKKEKDTLNGLKFKGLFSKKAEYKGEKIKPDDRDRLIWKITEKIRTTRSRLQESIQNKILNIITQRDVFEEKEAAKITSMDNKYSMYNKYSDEVQSYLNKKNKILQIEQKNVVNFFDRIIDQLNVEYDKIENDSVAE